MQLSFFDIEQKQPKKVPARASEAKIAIEDAMPSVSDNKARIDRLNRLTEQLIDDYRVYDDILINGSSDINLTDGMALDKKYTHIMYRKHHLRILNERYNLALPEIYYREDPVEHPLSFKARKTA